MTRPCPRCGGKMKRSKSKRDGKYVTCFQGCPRCDYSERAKYLPETLIEFTPVQKCTRSVLNLPQNDPISAPESLLALEQ